MPLGDLGIRLTAVGGIVVLSAINYVGVRPGSAVQTGADDRQDRARSRVLLVLLFGAGHAAHAGGRRRRSSRAAFLRALVAGLFAFGGWHMVTYAAEETRNPERTIPRALMLGTAVVVVIYLALNARVPARAAVRPRAGVDAHRVRRDAGDRRRRRRRRRSPCS